MYVETRKLSKALLILLVVGFERAGALPPETALDDARATQSSGSSDTFVSYGEARRWIMNACNIGVSIESSYFDHAEKINFAIRENEHLTDIIDRFCVGSKGLYTSGSIHGFPYIKPVIADGEILSSALDSHISISLTNASTWDAMKEFLFQLNATRALPRDVVFGIGYLDRMCRPPNEFGDQRTINLDIANATARDVLCRIMKESPVEEIQYVCFNNIGIQTILMIYFPKDGRYSLDADFQMDDDEYMVWREDLAELNDRCEQIFSASRSSNRD